ncbi:hypothetical protein [Ktedonobacter robiniae]|uniref:hypothetical protein n=1 Tax=Ktedonobacter robiniae TaxID=2778365 RepID=UPI001F2EE8FB|nr:hypothetical protein [Ktedonobacter robiniae]
MSTISAPTLASEIGYALHQILILHPTHPLIEVCSCVNDDGTIERSRLTKHVSIWSSQLRRPQANPRVLFFQHNKHTQHLLLQRGTAYALLGNPEQARQDLHALLQRTNGSRTAVEGEQRGNWKGSPVWCSPSSPQHRNATQMRSHSGNRPRPGSNHRSMTC